jgi:hypothetical protein
VNNASLRHITVSFTVRFTQERERSCSNTRRWIRKKRRAGTRPKPGLGWSNPIVPQNRGPIPSGALPPLAAETRLARIPAWTCYQPAQTRSFRQGDSANSAASKCQHDDEHLREDGECGRSECDEVSGNDVCNYCATREARKYANYVEVFLAGSLQVSTLDAVTGNLAERGIISLLSPQLSCFYYFICKTRIFCRLRSSLSSRIRLSSASCPSYGHRKCPRKVT